MTEEDVTEGRKKLDELDPELKEERVIKRMGNLLKVLDPEAAIRVLSYHLSKERSRAGRAQLPGEPRHLQQRGPRQLEVFEF
jgi:hypothetical protein